MTEQRDSNGQRNNSALQKIYMVMFIQTSAIQDGSDNLRMHDPPRQTCLIPPLAPCWKHAPSCYVLRVNLLV